MPSLLAMMLCEACDEASPPQPSVDRAEVMASFCLDAQVAVEAAVGIPHDVAQIATALGSDASSLDQAGKTDLATTTRAFASLVGDLEGLGPLVSVFLEDDASGAERHDIDDGLGALPGFRSASLGSKRAAFRRAANIMAGEEWFSGVPHDNFPAAVRATFAPGSDPTTSSATIKRLPGVRDVTVSTAVVDDLSLREFRLAAMAACPDIDLWPADPQP